MNTSSKTARALSTAVKSQIDENLKRVYEHALNEEVPDRFKQLLEQLKTGGAPAVSSAGPGQHAQPGLGGSASVEAVAALGQSQMAIDDTMRRNLTAQQGASGQTAGQTASSETTE